MQTHSYKLDPPVNWQDFEKMCHLLWMDLLDDPHIQLHGRQGQGQSGVDVYGTDKKTGHFICIQCKGKDGALNQFLTEDELHKEVEKARNFAPTPPDVFILATTAKNDVNIQSTARQLTLKQKEIGSFPVYVFGWGDLSQRIAFSERVINEFYPQYSEGNKSSKYNISELANIIADAQTNYSKVDKSLISKSITKDYFDKASYGLTSWPQTLLSNDQWIERNEENDILTLLDNAYFSTTILLGEPGTGKSALLSRLGEKLIKEDKIVLAIKSDQLDVNIKNNEDLGSFLGLPGPIDTCVLKAKDFGNVYLLIDQLDALSELIDVKTERLSVLLNLINKLSNHANVHIIASSRPFEYNFDSRFSTIKANKVQLQPLEYNVVSKIFEEHNVFVQNVDENFKKFISRPSNLNFYLKNINDLPDKRFQSHIGLYDEIWNKTIIKSPSPTETQKFLMDVASIMTNEAKQSLPLIRFNADNIISWLADAGLLVLNKEKRSFAFAHQTLHAYMWMRSFIGANNSLIDFVISHQNNLNIRPKLSTALFYLRDADDSEYNSQIEQLLDINIHSVRSHITHLCIDCICSFNDPNPTELRVLGKLLKNQVLKARILNGILGKEIWFDKLINIELNNIMNGDDKDCFWAGAVLASFLPNRKEAVLSHINKNWNKSTHLKHIYNMLFRNKYWDNDIVNIAINLISNEESPDHYAEHIFYNIGQTNPELAIKFAGAYFQNKLKKLTNAKKPKLTREEPAENASLDEKISYQITTNPNRELEALANFSSRWHNLPEFAQQYPAVFLTQFWNIFVSICEQTESEYLDIYNAFPECSGTWFQLSDDNWNNSDDYFSDSLENSIKAFAQYNSVEFLKFYHLNKEHKLLPIQRILAKGLLSIANTNATEVLNFLLEDERRFQLGNLHSDRFTGTIELIKAMVPTLDDNQTLRLENAILAYNSHVLTKINSPADRQYYLQRNRRDIYLLISAIPENVLSEDSKDLKKVDERFFGANIQKRSRFGSVRMRKASSPITLDSMQNSSLEKLIQLIKGFPDGRENDHLTEDVFYSSVEIARVFGNYAEKSPQKAVEIISKLEETNLYAVTFGLSGLSKSEIALDSLLELIEQIEVKFTKQDFFSDAARAIKNKITEKTGINNYWCKKIEGWIRIETIDHQKSVDTENHNENKLKSFLWDRHKMYGVPSKNYPILVAVTIGYLTRPEPAIKEYYSFINNHIFKKDSIDIWLAYMGFNLPRILHLLPEDNIEEFLDNITIHYPDILEKDQFALTLAWAAHELTVDNFLGWVSKLYNHGSEYSRQIAGELLGLKLAISDEDPIMHDVVAKAISQNNDKNYLIGLAHALSNVWKDRKPAITPHIIKMFELDDMGLSSILLGLIGKHDNPEYGKELIEILDTIARLRTIEKYGTQNHFLADALSKLAIYEPNRISILTQQLINYYGDSLGDLSTATSVETGDLISISITLHNSGPKYQATGLDLFEQLLEIDAYQVRDVLQKIDNIPTVQAK